MTKPRLALVGCGNIAEFHAPAFRKAGFELAAVTSKPGSIRLHPFAEKHQIPLVFNDPISLFEARTKWDAVLIMASTEATIENLSLATQTDAPIMVEKPVSLYATDLEPLINQGRPILVGYNRRFYRTVQEARIDVTERGPVLAHMSIPDSVTTPNHPDEDPGYLKRFFSNSIHGLDMLRYVFGNLKLEHVQRNRNYNGAITGLAAIFTADGGSTVQLSANWKTPANFTLTLDHPGRRLELKPFEEAAVYEGMEIIEPNPESPIRSFRPKRTEQVKLDEWDYILKPGFLGQAKAFLTLINGGNPSPAATLEDAHEALKLAEQLTGEPCG